LIKLYNKKKESYSAIKISANSKIFQPESQKRKHLEHLDLASSMIAFAARRAVTFRFIGSWEQITRFGSAGVIKRWADSI